MKRIIVLLVAFLLSYMAFPQSPNFTSQPNLLGGFVCFNQTAEILAHTTNADQYQLEVQQEDGSWSNYGGYAGDASSGTVSISIANYVQKLNFRIKITNTTSGNSNYSHDFFVSAQQPEFTVNPIHLIQCYNQNVRYYVAVNGASPMTYQWQVSDGSAGPFSDLSNSAKYKNVNTDALEINGIKTSDNDSFRCKVTDVNGCVNYSSAGSLSVNYMGTVKPTASNEFCEGTSQVFYTDGVTGLPQSYQWQYNGNVLADGEIYSGVQTDHLNVDKIPADLNRVGVEITYQNVLMNGDGTAQNGTCTYARERTGYLVNAMPDSPSIVEEGSVCGSGSMDLEVSNTDEIFWYAAENTAEIGTGSIFSTPNLSESTTYYARAKNEKGCFSEYTPVLAKVNPIPSLLLEPIEPVCPNSEIFKISYLDNLETDLFSIIETGGNLLGFTAVHERPLAPNSLEIALPSGIGHGTYQFNLKLKNSLSSCESEDIPVELYVKAPTEIQASPLSQSVCETETASFQVMASGEGVLSYQWFFNEVLLETETKSELVLSNLSLMNSGQYKCQVTGECGAVWSESAELTVLPKTRIEKQPEGKTVCPNQNAVFEIQATGTGTLSYQWKLNGENIGEDSPILTLEQVSPELDNAEVECTVTGDCGFENSAIATLQVLPMPLKPLVQNLGYCQNALSSELTAEASSGNSLLWYGQNESGGVAENEAPIPPTDVAGVFNYYVTQLDENGCESLREKIEVNIIPEIIPNLASSSIAVCPFGLLNRQVSFVASASGGDGTYSFQWVKDGFELTDEKGASYIGEGAGTYTVKISSAYCETSSELTILELNAQNENGPEIGLDGLVAPYAVCPGSAIDLTSSNGLNNAPVYWFTSEDDNVVIYSGATFSVPNLNTGSHFYAAYREEIGVETCESNRSSVEISLLQPPKVDVLITEETCENANDGIISLLSKTEFTPYQYKLDEGEFQANSSFQNLGAGVYNIEVKDANGCETSLSIELKSAGSPQFTVQPVDQTNCKGNTVTFLAETDKETSFQWQKKLPDGVWENISGAISTSLKLTNVGNSANPNQTEYRVLAGSEFCPVISEVARLYVNEFTENLEDQMACEGGDVVFMPPATNGTILAYQWQKRVGTSGSWTVVQDGETANYTILSAEKMDDNTYYRVRLTFDKAGNGTCVETSDQGKLSIISISETSLSGASEICAGQTIKLSAEGCNGEVHWSDEQIGAEVEVSPTETTVYTAQCLLNGCKKKAENILEIVVNQGISAPILATSAFEVCSSDSVIITASGCVSGILWSNGAETEEIKVKPAAAETYSAVCVSETCQSPVSNEITITGYPQLDAGKIAEFSTVNCAGYNPPTISSLNAPSGGKGVLAVTWEMTENCEAATPNWEVISGATSLTFNPNTLQETTCYRRKVEDECGNSAYSNRSKIQISPDPTVTVTSSKSVICSNTTFDLRAEIIGGAGACNLTWQRNLKSAAPTSSFWENIAGSDSILTVSDLENTGSENISVFYRAIYDCSLSSCNKATSATVEIEILPSNEVEFNVSDTTLCAGNSLNLQVSSCGADLVWSDGFVGFIREVSPKENTKYAVECIGECGTFSAEVNVSVIEGIAAPINTTPSAALFPDEIQFSALGTNLKWYSANHPDSLLVQAPLVSGVGNYSFWVSQSNETCESLKLQVFSKIYPQLAILQEPTDQYDCEGNSVKFVVDVEGAGNIAYQWQRKRPGEADFVNVYDEDAGIKNAQQRALSVSGVGGKNNPNLSQYRCIIGDSLGLLYTNPKTLYANMINRTLPNFKTCVGNDFEIDLNANLELIGDISAFEWQIRDEVAGKWVELNDDGFISGTKSSVLKIKNIQAWHARKYRCRIYFVTGGFHCAKNTDQTLLKVGEYPNRPPDLFAEYCQSKTTKTLSYNAKPGNDYWFLSDRKEDKGTTKPPRPSSVSAGEFIWWFAAVSNEGCEGPRAKYTVTIHPSPDKPRSTTPLYVMEGDTLEFTAIGENLKWFTSRTGRKFQTTSPRYTKVGDYQHYVSATSKFGCEGPREIIGAEIRGRLGLKKDLENLADCEGNSIRFTAKGKGAGDLKYCWEKKLPGDSLFVDIEGAIENSLKIDKVGSAEFPHLTAVRVVITDSSDVAFTSDSALVLVNKILGNLKNQVHCEFGEWKPDTSGFSIQGEVKEYQLQIQEGRSWLTLDSASTLLFRSENIRGTAEDDYRIRLTFKAEGNATCVRTTNKFSFKSLKNPEPLGSWIADVCQYAVLKPNAFSLPDSQFVWFTFRDSLFQETQLDAIRLDKLSDTLIGYAVENELGCISSIDSLKLRVLPAPELSLTDSLLYFCQSSSMDTLKLAGVDSLNWFKDETLKERVSPALVSSDSVGKFDYWVNKSYANGCISPSRKVQVYIERCDSLDLVQNLFEEKLGQANLNLRQSENGWIEKFVSDSEYLSNIENLNPENPIIKVPIEHEFLKNADALECSIFPNPASVNQEIEVFCLGSSPIYFDLYDAKGKKIEIKSTDFGNSMYKLRISSDLKEGVYILRILDAGQQACMKKVVIKN